MGGSGLLYNKQQLQVLPLWYLRKQKISKYMNKSRVIALFTVLVAFAVVALVSSCDRNEDSLETSKVSRAYLPSSERTVASTFSASADYDVQASPAVPSVGKLGTSFYFKFRGKPGSAFSQFDVRIRFIAPSGQEVCIPMIRRGVQYDGYATFELNRKLVQSGEYRFEYGYWYNNRFTVIPGVTQQSLTVTPPPSIPLGDDYPWKGKTKGNDDWGYTRGWCTSWVAWKVKQMWGSPFYESLGDARKWKSALIKLGYSCDQNPQVGDIVWIEPGKHYTNSVHGHVGFVNSVDGNVVVYTQYNGDKLNAYSEKTIYKNNLGYRYFIHVQQKK